MSGGFGVTADKTERSREERTHPPKVSAKEGVPRGV
jgi:hypothetical protein